MQTIDDKLYPFDNKYYIDNLSIYPNDVKAYKNPSIPIATSAIKSNLCSSKISELTADTKCICNNKSKVAKIIEGNTFYFCK